MLGKWNLLHESAFGSYRTTPHDRMMQPSMFLANAQRKPHRPEALVRHANLWEQLQLLLDLEKDNIEELQMAVAARSTDKHSLSSRPGVEPRVSAPELFNRALEKLHGFLHHCTQISLPHPDMSKPDKIMCVGLGSGNEFKESTELMLEGFVQELKMVFDLCPVQGDTTPRRPTRELRMETTLHQVKKPRGSRRAPRRVLFPPPLMSSSIRFVGPKLDGVPSSCNYL